MAGTFSKDIFANRFQVSVSETIVGTPGYKEVPTYASAFSKEAFIIHRMEYCFLAANMDSLVAAGDMLFAALTSSNKISILDCANGFPEPGVLDNLELRASLRGAAANLWIERLPIVHDFTSLPGGGIIVPARPLFIGVQSAGLGAAVTVNVRGWFTKVDLKGEDYLELVDAYRLIQ